MSESGDADDTGGLFAEPEGYWEKEKQPTFVTHRTSDGKELSMRLVGHSALWVGDAGIMPLSAKEALSCRLRIAEEPVPTA